MRAVGSWLVNKHGQHVYSAECKKKKRTYLQRESPSGDDAGQMEMRTNLDCGVLTQPNESNRIETNRNSINDQWKDLTGGPKGGGGGGWWRCRRRRCGCLLAAFNISVVRSLGRHQAKRTEHGRWRAALQQKASTLLCGITHTYVCKHMQIKL